MLTCLSSGFLEVETKDIRQLSRSKSSVTLTDREEYNHDLNAVLCEVDADDGSRCLVSFHSRGLKHSVVFAIDGPQDKAWTSGETFLADRGFRLEAVNLDLSPAMLEVVLKDVPGLATPGAARRQREERLATLAELQRLADEDPDGPVGKNALLKLDSQQRFDAQTARLRSFLVERFAAEQEAEERQRLARRVEELALRLAEAERNVREERGQRAMSETITAAAEKRIQELEEILVDVETTAGKELKEKAQAARLKKQLKERDESLEAARAELAQLQGRHDDLAAQVGAAQQEIGALGDRLKEAEAEQARAARERDEVCAELAAAEEWTQQARTGLGALEAQVQALEKEKQEAGRELARLDKAAQAAGDLQMQHAAQERDALRAERDELGRTLQAEQDRRVALEDELDEALRMVEALEKAVREGQKGAGQAAGSVEDREKLLKLEANLALLNEQLAQERGRQRELAEALARAEQAAVQAARAAPPPAAPPVAEAEAPKSAKPLPHELRPAPKKDAFFRPDWDLAGLPCASVDQVCQAWETVYNVQISLEGYPSQYCMAYLVGLKVDKVKKLYMVFRLKQTQHTLVCVPSQTPKNEKELQAAIAEGLKFLKSSGFDMEKMPEEYVEGTLGGFFTGA